MYCKFWCYGRISCYILFWSSYWSCRKLLDFKNGFEWASRPLFFRKSFSRGFGSPKTNADTNFTYTNDDKIDKNFKAQLKISMTVILRLTWEFFLLKSYRYLFSKKVYSRSFYSKLWFFKWFSFKLSVFVSKIVIWIAWLTLEQMELQVFLAKLSLWAFFIHVGLFPENQVLLALLTRFLCTVT